MRIKIVRKTIGNEDVYYIYQGLPMLLFPLATRWMLDAEVKSEKEVLHYLQFFIGVHDVTIKIKAK